MKTIKKYQNSGKPITKKNTSDDKVPKGYVRGEMFGNLMTIKEFKQRQAEMTKGLEELRKTNEPKPAPKKKMKMGGKLTTAKGGKQMLKRADGSTSQRGLWDNIRAAKGSGKKPTAAMLKQEKKIKAKSK